MIRKLIEDYFHRNTKDVTEHRDRLYPTQSSVFVNYGKHKRLHGKCIRAAYYSCSGIPEVEGNNKITSSIVMKLGDYVEKMIIDILSNNGVVVESGTKFEIEKYNIFGKLDAIIKIEDEEIGLEIKSIGSNKYTINEIFGSPWNSPYPKWHHLLQTLMYCYAFRNRINKFVLLYIRRDTGDIKEFTISLIVEKDFIFPVVNGVIDGRYSISDILDRYALLQNYLQEQTVPPRDFIKVYPKSIIPQYIKYGIISKKQAEDYKTSPFGDRECSWCGYNILCERDS